jgi:hypothetical protein
LTVGPDGPLLFQGFYVIEQMADGFTNAILTDQVQLT